MQKYGIYVLMCVIFAGCIWFIFAPSADDRAKVGAAHGFNADIPMPTKESIIGDKRDAYEQAQMQQRQEERMHSLQDFSELLGDDAKKTDDLAMLPDAETAPKKVGGYVPQASIQSSAQAYCDMNRTLGSFYEKPKDDPEKEELKRQVEEMQAQMSETENRKNSTDAQLELMEKSFQMAARYIPGTGGTGGTLGMMGTDAATAGSAAGLTPTSVTAGVAGKAKVAPVSQVCEQTVSALLPEMSNTEFIRAYGRPRNMGFLTAAGNADAGAKNTLSACIYGDQTVMDGQNVRLRLLEPMQAGNVVIPRNTVLSGTAGIQGERLGIAVHSLETGGAVIPVSLTVYGLDGQYGVFIPDMAELSAAREIVANMGTSAGTGINLSNDAGKQFAADMGRSVIQGVSQFTAKKLREVKVHLKADYRVFLLPEGRLSINN
jgi:conjugative transposon TraM protein